MIIRPYKVSAGWFATPPGTSLEDKYATLNRMKQKTSITLDPETLAAVDRLAARGSNRSRVIEQAVQEFIARLRREERELRDFEILNRTAEDLNEEMADVLAYQADL